MLTSSGTDHSLLHCAACLQARLCSVLVTLLAGVPLPYMPFTAFPSLSQKFWHSRMACSQQSTETDICKPNMQDVFEAEFSPLPLTIACSEQLLKTDVASQTCRMPLLLKSFHQKLTTACSQQLPQTELSKCCWRLTSASQTCRMCLRRDSSHQTPTTACSQQLLKPDFAFQSCRMCLRQASFHQTQTTACSRQPPVSWDNGQGWT